MRKAAARLTDRLAELVDDAGLRLEPGEITAYSGGIATVRWRGAEIQAPHLAAYAPTVGHVVLVAVQPPQLVILGRLVGTP